jgi:hypothetical protein
MSTKIEKTPQHPPQKEQTKECDHSPKHEQTLANLKKLQQQNQRLNTRTTHHHNGNGQPQHPNKLALTFGTLLSSQRTDAHPWKSLDRLRGNLIYFTG